jgi:hypothetical protein
MGKKKKSESPSKQKQHLELRLKELEERLRSTIEERDGLAATLAATEASNDQLRAKEKVPVDSERGNNEPEKTLSQENRLLRVQLEGIQKELELIQTHAEARKAALLTDFAGAITAKSIFLDNPVLNPPHLHLNFVFSGVELCGEQFGELHARIVDHHGRPGVLIFHDTIPGKLFINRRVDGQEEGRTFTLVVPEDPEGRAFLTACSAMEYLLFRGSAEILRSHLVSASTTNAGHLSHWRHVAKHFLALLSSANGCRFKCGHHEWTVAPESGHISSKLSRLSCAGCYVPEISACLTDAGISFGIPHVQSSLPVSSWPRTEAGAPALQAEFTVKSPSNGESPWWLKAPETDRLILRELLDFLSREWHANASRHPLHKRHLKKAHNSCSKLRSRLV